jgi:hypothetical protein
MTPPLTQTLSLVSEPSPGGQLCPQPVTTDDGTYRCLICWPRNIHAGPPNAYRYDPNRGFDADWPWLVGAAA